MGIPLLNLGGGRLTNFGLINQDLGVYVKFYKNMMLVFEEICLGACWVIIFEKVVLIYINLNEYKLKRLFSRSSRGYIALCISYEYDFLLVFAFGVIYSLCISKLFKPVEI